MVFRKTYSKFKKIMKKKKPIQRPGDLSPLGVRSTIKGNYSFNETFEHIFKESRKPINL
jgi:hypothetical protein